MLKNLISRPLGVVMTTIALVLISIFFVKEISISLLPNIPIPQISIHISAPELDARTMENTVTRIVRNQLLQVNHLKDIESQTRNGSAIIELLLDYGVNTSLSYIEINERIDQIMSLLPRNLVRPRVIQTNISDIPVFYLSMIIKDTILTNHLEFSDFAKTIIRRRLEQQDEIAFVDIHGITEPEIVISPNVKLISSLNSSEKLLKLSIQQSNIELSNVLIRDGHYEYYIKLNNRLKNIDDVAAVIVKIADQNYRLDQLASITKKEAERRGSFISKEYKGISLAIRKKADSNNFALRKSINELLLSFESEYPNIEFTLTNDQSEILQSSFNSLRSSLFYGLSFACLILFFFFRDWRLPILIITVVPTAMIVTLFIFYLIGLSVNIISLSGLILGVGLMIDNSIIITENIKRHQLNSKLSEACVNGPNEVIRPLISSALTTCSVFLPLILLNGLTGSLFYDQALSISISLGISLLVSYFLLPVLANLIFRNKELDFNTSVGKNHLHGTIINTFIKYRWPIVICFLILLGLLYIITIQTSKKAFPQITRTDYVVSVDWNESIPLERNEERALSIFQHLSSDLSTSEAYLGELQYLLLSDDQNLNEAKLNFYFIHPPSTFALSKLREYIKVQYPETIIEIKPLPNVFDQMFTQDPNDVYARLQSLGSLSIEDPQKLKEVIDLLNGNGIIAEMPPLNTYIEMSIDHEKLLIYNVTYDAVVSKLRSSFRSNVISNLKSNNDFIPIQLAQLEKRDVFDILSNNTVRTINGDELSLSIFVSTKNKEYYKTLESGRSGERISIPIPSYNANLIEKFKGIVGDIGNYTIQFEGPFFENKKILNELMIIGFLVLGLLYVILAAQFESFIQPFIIALTLPIGSLGAICALNIFGESLNVMSVVGIIVLSGIDVNDAILKIDMFNRNRNKGMSLTTAIVKGSEQRLRPIIMTSLTTILAMIPILYASGLGGELQRPLAVSLIGGLLAGTLASLVLIPIFYYMIYQKEGA